MITVCLSGGLGNQMFTYAYARALQEENKEKKLIIDTYDFKHDFREYSMYHLKLNENLKKSSSLREKLLRIYLRFNFGNKMDSRPTDEQFYILAKKGFYYDFFPYSHRPVEQNSKKIKVVKGYFQSHKNFENIKNVIVEEFTVVTPPSEANQKTLDEISKDNAVCVHIRRGDYVNNPGNKALNICTEEYYLKAMDIISNKVENPVFYVFSTGHDDIEWIKQNYRFNYNVRYVDLDNPDYEELRLMYNCKHFIISNSTFSWWAQYLSKNENKVVVAPSEWNHKSNPDNIYMDNWEIVDVNG